MSYSGRIEKLLYKAYSLGLHENVFEKFNELTQNKRTFDITEAYEQAYKLVINEYTNKSIIQSS